MSQPTAPLLDVEKIEVEEGFNVRTHIDEEGLEQLAANVTQVGVIEPVIVKPGQNGHYVLVAGHRRFRAAQLAGLKQVPAVLGDAERAKLTNLVENIHQEKLNPIDEGRGLKQLGEELGAATIEQLAEVTGKKAAWIGQRLRLLKLPEGVQRYVAEGTVPVEAERVLRKVAKVSPRVAECVCELAKRRKVKSSQFVEGFGELLQEVAYARFEQPPTMIEPRRVAIRTVVADREKREELIGRIAAVYPNADVENAEVSFGEAELDAARAAGCLLEHTVEHNSWSRTVAFVVDAEFAADLIERVIERIEAQAAERQRALDGAGNGGDPAESETKEREDRKAQRAEAEARRQQARRFNEELGVNLLKRRGAASRREHGLARVKALAAVIVADNGWVAERGLRLVLSQLQDVEVKTTKAGKTKEKVSYADREQCTEYLFERLKQARSEKEGLEILADTLLAAVLADEAALPQSGRTFKDLRGREAVEKLLAAEIKEVRPRRRRKSGK